MNKEISIVTYLGTVITVPVFNLTRLTPMSQIMLDIYNKNT